MTPATQSDSQYQPTSRRPIADAFRRTAHGAVRLCVRAGIHPDAVSYCSVVAAGLAAVCFWQAALSVRPISMQIDSDSITHGPAMMKRGFSPIWKMSLVMNPER